MNVLFATSEAYPFMKVGGLGDVAYALPKALIKLGMDVRVILPLYNDIPEKFKSQMQYLTHFDVPVGFKTEYCGIMYLEYDSIPFYFIDNEYYFKRKGAYGYDDDGERFSYFSKAILRAINFIPDFTPDVIHCNDWQTAILPVLLKDHYRFYGNYSNIKTVYTIHNLRYQGRFGKEVLAGLLNLNDGYYSDDALKYYEDINYMKGGITFADWVTTVSKTYAEEIRTPEYGEGLHGLLHINQEKLSGIVNGIDFDLFNPETDKLIKYNFSADAMDNKALNKAELQKNLGLEVNPTIPMIGLVSRLVDQKGLDLIAHILEELMVHDVQFVVLGTGDSRYEDMFKYYAWKYPTKLSANIMYDNTLAQNIYASCDLFLMPSLFEPCGIGQMIALRYGSIPIVRETGGLKDTVQAFNEYTSEGNGFSFTYYNAHDMLFTIKRALFMYHNKSIWKKLMKTAMSIDNSWEKSALEYEDVYKIVTGQSIFEAAPQETVVTAPLSDDEVTD